MIFLLFLFFIPEIKCNKQRNKMQYAISSDILLLTLMTGNPWRPGLSLSADAALVMTRVPIIPSPGYHWSTV